MNNLDTTIYDQHLRHRYFYQFNQDDAALIFDYFIMFSRFEFALKRAGYLTGDDNRAKPDWDKFCVTVQAQFDKTRTLELTKACEYYLKFPPKKQVVKNNQMVWKKISKEKTRVNSDGSFNPFGP